MFEFLRRGDVFARRKKQQEVWKALRRLIDTTPPNFAVSEQEARAHERCSRCFPMLLVPLAPEQPLRADQRDEPLYALTKDFSDNGVSCTTAEELSCSQVICGFNLDGPLFLAGEVRRSVPFGGGYWESGILLSEVVPNAELADLLPLVERLSPRTPEPV